MKPAFVVELLDEVGKVLGDVLEAFEGHRVDGFDLQGLHEVPPWRCHVGRPGVHEAGQLPRFQRLAVRLGMYWADRRNTAGVTLQLGPPQFCGEVRVSGLRRSC